MGIFKDFIPAGEALDAMGNGYSDFVPPVKPIEQELTSEEKLRLQRIENLKKAREVRQVKLAEASDVSSTE